MIYDIAFNAADKMYQGIYNGSVKHPPDIHDVIKKSQSQNIQPFLVGSNFNSSSLCLEYAKMHNTFCYVGIHPNDATPSKNDFPNIESLLTPENSRYILAIGECGLDYYRNYSSKEDQKYIFKKLLDLNYEHYFLHSRSSHRDFMEIISDYKFKGVVHSFDGTAEEGLEILKKGLYIGINGCSMKNYTDFIHELDINKILVETDAPYCRMTKSYKGYEHIKTFYKESKRYDGINMIRHRNEPLNVIQVIEAISTIKNVGIEELKNILRKNTIECFGTKIF